MRSRSPVTVTAPTGSVSAPEGPRSPSCTVPSAVVAVPMSRKAPEPARISALLAASTRYDWGPWRMVAVTADTAAASASRVRASSSWETNWSCLRASGETSASPGPVSIPPSCRAEERESAESRRSEATRSGPAAWGRSSTS